MQKFNGPVRWGIMGTGAIAKAFAKSMQHVANATLAGVGSRHRKSANDFATAHGIGRAHGSYDGLVKDPNIDVIYVATPHTAHLSNTLLCLSSGKHVLCEKPFALNEHEVTQMVQAAKDSGLFLMEAMWMRFIPLIVDLQRRITDGEIGEVRMIQADFGFRAPFDPQSRLFNPHLAGGALLDIGIYPLAFASLLLGEPEEIASVGHIGSTGVDEQSAYALKHKNGAISMLSSALRTRTSMSAKVFGTHGQIHLPSQFWRGQEMTIYRRNHEPEKVLLPYEDNGYQFEAQEVVDCLLAGRLQSEMMPLDDSISLMRTMDRIRSQLNLTYPAETR